MKPGQFHESISRLLTEKLRSVLPQANGTTKELNLVTCTEIYTTIFETMAEVITEAKIPLTNEAVNYLAQQYYDGVQVNGGQELDPYIFTHRAKVTEINTKELALLATMLHGTDFSFPIIEEIKKRS